MEYVTNMRTNKEFSSFTPLQNSKNQIQVNVTEGKVSASGFVAYGVIIVLILFIIGKFFLPILNKNRKAKHKAHRS